jgi:hypothetical protein
MRPSALALALIFAAITTACTRGESVAITPNGNDVTLRVRSSGDQIVYMAVGAIVQHYGYVITYEAPAVSGITPPWDTTFSMQLRRAQCGITSLPIEEMMSPDKMASTLQKLVELRGCHRPAYRSQRVIVI